MLEALVDKVVEPEVVLGPEVVEPALVDKVVEPVVVLGPEVVEPVVVVGPEVVEPVVVLGPEVVDPAVEPIVEAVVEPVVVLAVVELVADVPLVVVARSCTRMLEIPASVWSRVPVVLVHAPVVPDTSTAPSQGTCI